MSRSVPKFIKDIIESRPKKKIIKVNKDENKKEEKPPTKKTIEIVFEDSSEDESDQIDYNNPSGCKVVKIARKGGKIFTDCDVYIGRRCTMGGWDLDDSKWKNPFKVDEKNDIHKVLADFEYYMRNNIELMNNLEELKNKVLGCWCKKKGNEPCHGDVLVRLLNEKIVKEIQRKQKMEQKIKHDKIEMEKSKNGMSILEKILEENRIKSEIKKEEDELKRKEEEERVKYENKKRCDKRREIIKKYGENHEMSSRCESPIRSLTPIKNIQYTSDSPTDFSSFSQFEVSDDENDVDEGPQQNIGNIDKTIHTIMEKEKSKKSKILNKSDESDRLATFEKLRFDQSNLYSTFEKLRFDQSNLYSTFEKLSINQIGTIEECSSYNEISRDEIFTQTLSELSDILDELV